MGHGVIGVLRYILGRLPLGWIHLTHNKSRFSAALAGVALANVLVLVQVGVVGHLGTAGPLTFDLFQGDIVVSPIQGNSAQGDGTVAWETVRPVLSDPAVHDATGLFVGMLPWDNGAGFEMLAVFGVNPDKTAFLTQAIAHHAAGFAAPDSALFDAGARGISTALASETSPDNPLPLDQISAGLSAGATFSFGPSMHAAPALIVSEQTFLALFPWRTADRPDHILLALSPDQTAEDIIPRLRAAVAGTGHDLRNLADAAQAVRTDAQPQGTTGIIFAAGVMIGALIGLVTVYKVVSTDIADNMRQYAALKAMGYGQGYFLGIVVEQALILGVLGFFPGLIIGTGLLTAMGAMTALPLAMTPALAGGMFLGTLVFSVLSGAIATRRLAAADPADLF